MSCLSISSSCLTWYTELTQKQVQQHFSRKASLESGFLFSIKTSKGTYVNWRQANDVTDITGQNISYFCVAQTKHSHGDLVRAQPLHPLRCLLMTWDCQYREDLCYCCLVHLSFVLIVCLFVCFIVFMNVCLSVVPFILIWFFHLLLLFLLIRTASCFYECGFSYLSLLCMGWKGLEVIK